MNPLTRVQPLLASERVVDDHLVAPAVGEITAADLDDVVDDGLLSIRQRKHQIVDWIIAVAHLIEHTQQLLG